MTEWNKRDGIGQLHCSDVGEFLSVLSPSSSDWAWVREQRRRTWIFRGHADSSWALIPTAWREPRPSVLQHAYDIFTDRIPALHQVAGWDHTGSLPPPPVVDLDVARAVIVQANTEWALVSEFLYRIDELGIPTLGDLPLPLHEAGMFEHLRPVAADDFLQLPGLSSQAALAQHHGIPTRLLDWSDDPLVAAFFAASADSHAERLCVWALNEQLAPKRGTLLWDGVGLSLRIIRPPRSTNPFLRAQRGAFTLPWGAGCYALIHSGQYPRTEDIAATIADATGSDDVLRCITLPRSLSDDLLEALERRWITRDTLMPSAQTVARSIVGQR